MAHSVSPVGSDSHYEYMTAPPDWFRYWTSATPETCRICGYPIPNSAVIAEEADGQLVEQRCVEAQMEDCEDAA